MTVTIAAMTAPQRPQPATPRSDERLAKRVAAMLACSRREAEQYVEGGWVSVNARLVEEPMFRVLKDDKVDIDPAASLIQLTAVTLLLHKPPGVEATTQKLLSAASHAQDDASGIRLLKRHFTRLTACVPLETAASGLVVFTQDWRIQRKLFEDAAVMEQEVIVEVAGEGSPASLQRLNQGLARDGQPLPPVKVSLNSTGQASSKLRFAFKGAHPGLLAYLCERVGLRILSMKRIRVGRVAMAHLSAGQWRYLQPHERF